MTQTSNNMTPKWCFRFSPKKMVRSKKDRWSGCPGIYRYQYINTSNKSVLIARHSWQFKPWVSANRAIRLLSEVPNTESSASCKAWKPWNIVRHRWSQGAKSHTSCLATFIHTCDRLSKGSQTRSKQEDHKGEHERGCIQSPNKGKTWRNTLHDVKCNQILRI